MATTTIEVNNKFLPFIIIDLYEYVPVVGFVYVFTAVPWVVGNPQPEEHPIVFDIGSFIAVVVWVQIIVLYGCVVARIVLGSASGGVNARGNIYGCRLYVRNTMGGIVFIWFILVVRYRFSTYGVVYPVALV